MVDKIDNSGAMPPRRPDSANSRVQPSPAATPEASASPLGLGDERSQTQRSTFEQLHSAVAESGAVDHEKIEEIKSAIQRGDYQINAQRIASAIVDLEQLLSA